MLNKSAAVEAYLMFAFMFATPVLNDRDVTEACSNRGRNEVTPRIVELRLFPFA
jgi:hypothetical protein